MEMDPIVLSYHNSLLRKSDVTLLDEPNWLNDNVIGFYFEWVWCSRSQNLHIFYTVCHFNITRYLEYEVFKEHADKVCFITPDVTQFIKLYEGEVTDLHDLGALISFYPVRHWFFSPGPELGIFLEPLSLDKKDVVILAVNDNSSSKHAGGSHWWVNPTIIVLKLLQL